MNGDGLPDPVPLGPDSVLGRLAADWRIGLTGLSAGLLQLMHPGLGAGVTDHSAFFTEPFERIVRSVPRIVASITARDGEARARPSTSGSRCRGARRRSAGPWPCRRRP